MPDSNRVTALRVRLGAPPEKVYRALVEPDLVGAWLVPSGMTSHVHEFDVREGGRFRISLTYAAPTGTGKTSAQTDTYHGRFVEIRPNERMVQILEFETEAPELRGEMRITYTLAAAGGSTELRAVHEGLPPGLSPRDNEFGWRESLGKLADLVKRL